MDEESVYKRELSGFNAKEDLLNTTSNNKFIFSNDVDKNLFLVKKR